MKLLKSDTFLKVISLVIAIGLWFYIVQVHDPDITKRFKNVPVVFSQLADLENKNLTLLNDKDITVDVEVKGNRKNIMNITSSDITVIADVSTIERAGENNITTTVILPYGNLEITNKRPSTIKVSVDTLCSKGIDVKLTLKGDPKEGYVLGSSEITPGKIHVTGAETVVESIDYIGAEIDVSGKSSDITTVISDLTIYDSNNNKMVSPLVKLDVENVNVRCEIVKVKSVKLNPIIPRELIKGGYIYRIDKKATPSSIHIKGSADVIDDINSINTKPISIHDIDGEKAQIELELPQGVSLFTGNTQTITFTKEPIAYEVATSE